jgi:hypothetical protein
MEACPLFLLRFGRLRGMCSASIGREGRSGI